MNDKELRQAIINVQKRFGTTTTFIAIKCGVSREHLSRWIRNEDYMISNELKIRLANFTKEDS